MNPSQNPSALRSKKMILDTMARLMEQYPYQEITVKQIIMESDVARKTFYRNFNSKDDVLFSYLDATLCQYIEEINEKEAYSIRPMLEVIFLFCERNKEFFRMLQKNNLLHLMIMRLNRLIPEYHEKITRATERTGINDEVVTLPQYIVSFNIGGVWNIITQWIENDMLEDSEEIKKVIENYLLNIAQIDLRDL